MGQSSRLNIADVIGHLRGRDASLSKVYASDGIPKQAKAYRRSDDLAVTITQGQQRNTSSDLTMRPLSSTVEYLGMKTVLLAAKCVGTTPPSSIRFLH